jgi:hypothetical protein
MTPISFHFTGLEKKTDRFRALSCAMASDWTSVIGSASFFSLPVEIPPLVLYEGF